MQSTASVVARSPGRAGAFLAGILSAGFLVWTPVAAAQAALPAEGFADLAEKVTPAVVNISSIHNPEGGTGEGMTLEDLMRRYGEGPMGDQPATAMGSGFLIDAEGHIVTNDHVIDGADAVTVNLADGRSFEAEVIGTDPATDLALLKIDADKALSHVSFGDSDALRVGDVVLAVGNPFGLGGSVTAGIVSARGRDIHAGPFDDFIQTDAAINRGNSGGPMFNTKGEVVGINSAIFSPTGGSVGIGFAIPSSLAKQVIADLQERGSVQRGWLGVSMQEITPDIQHALGLEQPSGALVAQVLPDTPAARAKLQQGDVILQFGKRSIDEPRDLSRAVAETPAGSSETLVILRNGEQLTVKTTIGERSEQQRSEAPAPEQQGPVPSEELGALVAPLDESLRAELGLGEVMTGVALLKVMPDGRAAQQGLADGDVIKQVGQQAVETPRDLASALEGAGDQPILLLVNRGGNERFVAFKTQGA